MGNDAPTTARVVGLPPRRGQYFLSKRKKVPKKARGTATPKAAHVAMRRGLRPAVAPLGLSSSTGCPVSHSSLLVALLASHPPCGSLWAAPKAPLGPRFPSGQFAALTRRKKASIAHFDGGARNVARNGVGQLSPALGARSCSPFSAVKMGGPFSLRCLSPPCPGAVSGGHTQPLQGGM